MGISDDSRLLRASELLGEPVVTFGGEDVAEVKDVVYDGTGSVIGFTLNGRGFLASPLDEVLHTSDLHWIGPDAVMIRSAELLAPADELLSRTVASGDASGDVLGSQVYTDAGKLLGEVVDVIVAADTSGDVVGYEVRADAGFRGGQPNVFVPLPDTLAAGGENLVVPEAAEQHVTSDLAGFAGVVRRYREGEG